MQQQDLDELVDRVSELELALDHSYKSLNVMTNKYQDIKRTFKRDLEEAIEGTNKKLYDQANAYMQLFELARDIMRRQPNLYKVLTDHPQYFDLIKKGGYA